MSIAITTTPFKDAHEIHDLEKQLRQHISEQSKKIDTALYKKIIDTVTKGPLRRPDLVTLCGQELLFGDVSSSFKKSVDAIYRMLFLIAQLIFIVHLLIVFFVDCIACVFVCVE